MRPDPSQTSAHAALTLLGLPRIGIREWHRRVSDAGSAVAALRPFAGSAALQASVQAAEQTLARAAAIGVAVIAHGDEGYPRALHDLTACEHAEVSPAPPVIYTRGQHHLLDRPAVAIVGTRHASATGLRAATRIARDCADAGALVISGLARGIDAAAHTGALDGDGVTAAVIGTGLDVAYPADHRGLQQRIARNGLLLSESPPGQRATRGSFPERNRLIAALAQVTIVVEAGHRSGALLTARAADALNRTTAAVPGAFDSASCLGSNELLRDGAQVIATTDDVLALLRLGRADRPNAVPPAQLTDAERAIWEVLGTAPLDLDLVVERSGWAADACFAAVTTLELKGLVRATHAGALHRA
ncbi:MAG: DNA-processing protein DprA [Gemmatimonadaceae bacterium]|nr:DNA-processing protein DprA [Gemmatimonadaceae bacterium]